MFQLFFLILVFFCLGVAPARPVTPLDRSSKDDAKRAFCARSLKGIQDQSISTENRLAFNNKGGFVAGNIGVCWWHSRLQRSALYLALFRPELSLPTEKEAIELIRALIRMDKVVEIPGYKNLEDFSIDFQYLIQRQLEFWQARETMYGVGWLKNALFRPSRLSARGLQKRMDQLFYDVNVRHRIPFLVLRHPGVRTHSGLVTAMAKTKQGYVLSWIDSNRPRFESEMIYQTGERSLFYELNDTRIEVAPYRDHEEELDTTLQAIEQWCGHPLLTNSS